MQHFSYSKTDYYVDYKLINFNHEKHFQPTLTLKYASKIFINQ